MANDIEKRAEELAARQYTEVAFRDKTTTGGYIYMAITPELDGCMAQGETMREAKENLRLFRIDYIQHLLENDLPVPDPAWMATETVDDSIVLRIDEQRRSFEEVLGEASLPTDRKLLYKAQLTVKNDEIALA